MKSLAIVGVGGLGRVVAQIVADINRAAEVWQIACFLDDNPALHGRQIHGVSVAGGVDWLLTYPHVAAVIAIANPVIRYRLTQKLQAAGYTSFVTLIHPTAWIGQRSAIGAGGIVYPGVMIDPDVQIGAHSVLNKGATIGHDCQIGDWVTVAPGVNLGGTLRVGDGCDIGIGSSTIQGLTVGAWSVIGAGSTVVRDVPPNVTVVGAPAHIIRERPAGWHVGTPPVPQA